MKVREAERQLEEERDRERTLQREINSLNLELNSKKAEVGVSAEQSDRVKWLNDELAKKQAELAVIQRDYRDALSAPMPVAGENQSPNVAKFEKELAEIKQMILEQKQPQKISDLMSDLDEVSKDFDTNRAEV